MWPLVHCSWISVLAPLRWAITTDLRYWLIFNLFQNQLINGHIAQKRIGMMNCYCSAVSMLKEKDYSILIRFEMGRP
jgi:hypothetical protein